MLLLGSLGTLNIVWSDMLFPAITSIQQDLGTSATAVQQTVSLFFVANALMCLWRGVLSDVKLRSRACRGKVYQHCGGAWGQAPGNAVHRAQSVVLTGTGQARRRPALA